jgi:DNA primase
METEKLSFVEAVQALAERFGVALPRPAEEEQNGQVYRALEEAATFYRRLLEDPEAGRAARAYLAGRGLAPATLEAYGVGLAPPGWDGLAQRLLPRFGAGPLLEAGLVLRRERGEGVYDRFRGRVVVPLRLPTGRVVGFGGRALGDEEPKYLNSPETAVYHKGRFLFGLDRARAAMRAAESAVLVEGYFDVLALVQAGVTEAVATAGTALTVEQCRILRRVVPAVALVFDGDAAGQAAAEKALVPCVLAGLAAQVVILPPGEDPDTLVRTAGRAPFDAARAAAQSPIGFLAGRHAADREAALRACARLAAAAEDPIQGALLVEEAARRLDFDRRALAREVEGLRRGGSRAGAPGARPVPPAPPRARAAPPAGPRARASRELEAGFLALVVAHPGLVEAAAARYEAEWFLDPVTRALAGALLGPGRRKAGALHADPDLPAPERELLSGLLATAAIVAHPERELAERMDGLDRRALAERQRRQQEEFLRLAGTGGEAEGMKRLQVEMQDTAAALRARASEARRKERA